MTEEQKTGYDSAIFNQATSMDIPDTVAKNIVAQARFETGDYSNTAFLEHNNAFGYKTYPGSKWQRGAGNISTEGDPYADYANVQDSTGELVDWLKRRQAEGKFTIASLTNPVDYANALKSCDYYGSAASDYANGLIAKLKLIDWKTVGVVAGGSAAVLLMVLAFFFLITKK